MELSHSYMCKMKLFLQEQYPSYFSTKSDDIDFNFSLAQIQDFGLKAKNQTVYDAVMHNLMMPSLQNSIKQSPFKHENYFLDEDKTTFENYDTIHKKSII